jgi:hypothetical protein
MCPAPLYEGEDVLWHQPASKRTARLDEACQAQIKQNLTAAISDADRLYGNRRVKSGEVSESAPEPLAALSAAKHRYCQTTPVDPNHDRSAGLCSARFELFIPANMYTSTSRGMLSLNGEAASTGQQIMYIQNMRILGYVARRALTPRVRTVVGPNPGDKPQRESTPSSSDIKVTWETVPHADPEKGVCGYRLRITESEQGGVSHMLDELLSLLQQNTAADDKAMMATTGVVRGNGAASSNRMRGGAPPRDPTDLGGVTMVQYMRLCDMYATRAPANTVTTEIKSHIVDRDSPYNPMQVFSPQRSWILARACGADPAFYRKSSYFQQQGTQWSFPDYSRVVYLHIDDINPSTLNNQFLPHVKPNLAPYHKQIRLWARTNGLEDNPDAAKLWASHFMQSSWTEKEYDIHALMHDITQQRDELRSKYKRPLRNKYQQRAEQLRGVAGPAQRDEIDDLESTLSNLDLGDSMRSGYYAELRRKQQGEWLTKFFEIISKTGACPPAAQSIMKYLDHYLEENSGYLTLHYPQTYRNLSRYANMRAGEACLLNSIMTVASCHQDALLYLWSAIHVFSRVPMNIHHLLLGPPGVGKSFAVLLLTRMLVAGTHMMLTYLTPKALAANGREMSWMCILLEDAPATLFGVKSGKGASAGASAGTDVVNMFKQMLTSMDIVARSLEMEPKRAGVTIKAEASLIVFACLNEDTSAFEPAVRDRFCVTVSAAEAKQDPNDTVRASLSNQASRSNQMPVKEAEKEMKLQWNRQQVLCAIGLLMESCGMFLPIDTSAADRVFHMVYRRAMAKNIDMEERRRNKLRFQMLVRVQCMAGAVDSVFNSPLSPVAGQKYHPSHWLHLEKYLVSTIEMGTYCIGMLARQWQDNTSASLVHTIKKKMFPHFDEILTTYSTLEPLAAPAPGESHSLHSSAPNNYDGSKPQAPVHPFGGRKPTRAQEESSEWAQYRDQEVLYQAIETTENYWMYATINFGSQQLPVVPGVSSRAPTQEELIEHVSHVISGQLSKRFLAKEIQGKIREMTTSSVKVSRLQHVVSDYDTEPVAVTEERPVLILTPECMRIAIPTLQFAGETDVLFNECQVVVSILSALAAKRGEDTSVYDNLIYGDTEPEANSRFVWRILRVNPNIEAELFSDPLGETMESQVEAWNAAFVEEATFLVTQDILSVSNPAYKDNLYMRRLFDAVVPWTRMDVNFDEHAALCRADLMGLSHHDQHAHLSNDINKANRAHKEYYRKNNKTMQHYPECFTVRQPKTYKDKWKKIERERPELFRASTTMKQMRERQTKRRRIEDDHLFEESNIDAPCSQPLRNDSTAKRARLVWRGPVADGDEDADDNTDAITDSNGEEGEGEQVHEARAAETTENDEEEEEDTRRERKQSKRDRKEARRLRRLAHEAEQDNEEQRGDAMDEGGEDDDDQLQFEANLLIEAQLLNEA